MVWQEGLLLHVMPTAALTVQAAVVRNPVKRIPLRDLPMRPYYIPIFPHRVFHSTIDAVGASRTIRPVARLTNLSTKTHRFHH
jgi:hypothetical protein